MQDFYLQSSIFIVVLVFLLTVKDLNTSSSTSLYFLCTTYPREIVYFLLPYVYTQ